MPKYLSVVLLAASFAIFAALSSITPIAVSQESAPVKIKPVPMQPTSPTSGQEMYASYCASCHGPNGKGDGPAAPALKSPPPDLTMLSTQNGGKFPADHVSAVLTFGAGTAAHGSADMPIWGPLFRTLHPSGNAALVAHQRVKNITDYLKEIQK